MSVDDLVGRAFDDLRARANTAVLPYGSQLRRRGDRRRRTRTATGLFALLLVAAVASVVAATTLPTAAPIDPATPPAPAPTVTARPLPTGVPRTENPPPAVGQSVTFPSGCPSDDSIVGLDVPTAGAPLPVELMPTAVDWGPCYVLLADEAGYRMHFEGEAQPNLCGDGALYDAWEHRIAGRSRVYTTGPETEAWAEVTQYEPGQAAAYLAEVRDRVARCATHPGEGVTMYSLILRSDFAGEESLMVYRGESATGGYSGLIHNLIRVGDLVITIRHGGEGGVDPIRDLEMSRVAANYLR